MRNAILILMILTTACADQTTPFRKTAPDTTFTTLLYNHNWTVNDYRTVTARKIVLDTFSVKKVDSFTEKKTWVRDSIYLIPFADTVKDHNKMPVYDSTGRMKMRIQWVHCPKEFILIDYNRNWK